MHWKFVNIVTYLALFDSNLKVKLRDFYKKEHQNIKSIEHLKQDAPGHIVHLSYNRHDKIGLMVSYMYTNDLENVV